MNKENILNYVSYVLGIAFCILFLIFQNDKPKLVVIISIFAILYGIVLFLKRENAGALLIGIGSSLGVSFICYYNLFGKDLGLCVTFFFFLSMVLISLCSFIFYFINNYVIKKMFPIKVEAQVVDLVKSTFMKRESYKPVYSYVYKDKEYNVEDLRFLNRFIPNIGDLKEIWISEDDSESAYFPFSKMEKFVNIATWIFFFILGIIVLVSLF